MTDHQDRNPYYARTVYRIVWGVSGFFLACLGIFVVFFGVVDLPIRIGMGLVIALLGVDAVWSSIQSKPSWLAKLVLFT
ncbi:MAG: hypothetical protein ABI351_02045 [Herbaspirillum sp.]